MPVAYADVGGWAARARGAAVEPLHRWRHWVGWWALSLFASVVLRRWLPGVAAAARRGDVAEAWWLLADVAVLCAAWIAVMRGAWGGRSGSRTPWRLLGAGFLVNFMSFWVLALGLGLSGVRSHAAWLAAAVCWWAAGETLWSLCWGVGIVSPGATWRAASASLLRERARWAGVFLGVLVTDALIVGVWVAMAPLGVAGTATAVGATVMVTVWQAGWAALSEGR